MATATPTYRRTLAILALIGAGTGVLACDVAASADDLAPAPAEVQASFTHFADSILPTLRDSLFRVGFRNHDAAAPGPSTAPVAFTVHTSPASATDRAADLYEGVIEAEIEPNGDAMTYWPMSLHFARMPGTSKWVLLTSAGYPDNGEPHTPTSAPRMPQLLLASAMPLFTDVQEWQSWWTLQDKRRAAVKKSRQ